MAPWTPATTRAVPNPPNGVSLSPTSESPVRLWFFGTALGLTVLTGRPEFGNSWERAGAARTTRRRGAAARIARREGELVAEDVVDHRPVTRRDDGGPKLVRPVVKPAR